MEKTMKNEIVITATTVEDAVEQALEQLGAQEADVEIEVIEEPVKRLFGEPSNAKVRVILLGGSQGSGVETMLEYDNKDNAIEENTTTIQELGDNPPGDETEGYVHEDSAEDEAGFEEKNFNEALVQLTDEELDILADTAIETIHEFLSYFGVQDASIDEYEGEEGELILDIVGDNLAVIIGRHGKTLDSFQFLVSAIVGKKTGYRHPIVIDVEGYKHRRKEKLLSIARSSAARVIKQKREISLRPMSPYERRIIHVALKNDKRVVTSSEGIEPARYVVIRPL
jgi:spoIIIJ-associated protein